MHVRGSMATPSFFTRTASAEMYATFEELALKVSRAEQGSWDEIAIRARLLLAIDQDGTPCTPVVTVAGDTDQSTADEADACDGIFTRTRSASRHYAEHLGTGRRGATNEGSDGALATRRRSIPQVRFEPYARCHAHVCLHVQPDLSVAAACTTMDTEDAFDRSPAAVGASPLNPPAMIEGQDPELTTGFEGNPGRAIGSEPAPDRRGFFKTLGTSIKHERLEAVRRMAITVAQRAEETRPAPLGLNDNVSSCEEDVEDEDEDEEEEEEEEEVVVVVDEEIKYLTEGINGAGLRKRIARRFNRYHEQSLLEQRLRQEAPRNRRTREGSMRTKLQSEF